MINTKAYTIVEHTHISLDELLPHPEQIRFYGEEGTQADEKLIASLAQYGQFDSIAVTEALPSGKRYIISGHRRCDALRKLGHTTVRCEVRRFESSVLQTDVLVQQNFQRDKTERQKNNEALYFIEFFSREAQLRKLQALKNVCEPLCSKEHNDERKGRTSDTVAEKMGESAMTIRRRKLVHYDPDRAVFLEEIATQTENEGVIRMCIEQWNRIREMNNEGAISIARAADMVRALKKEILAHSYAFDATGNTAVERGVPTNSVRVKAVVKTQQAALGNEEVFVYHANGIDCGFHTAAGLVMVRLDNSTHLLSWEKIVQHLDILF